METPQDTLSFEQFWSWLKQHFNCIVRAGGADFVLFDFPDLHWHLGEDLVDAIVFAQVYRGKELVAEVVVRPEEVLFVQSMVEEGEQTVFELMVATDQGPAPLSYFVLAHGYDVESPPGPRWTH